MVLRLNPNICISRVKNDLKNKIEEGKYNNDYSFEINLIYKIIHEYSNYEYHQWDLYQNDESFVSKQIGSLLKRNLNIR